MAHHTKEDCIRLGIPLADIKHRMTRRASWKKYWREGTYGITIHLNEDADLPGLSLGQAVGDVNVRPRLEDFETHPKRGENENPADNEKRGENENPADNEKRGEDENLNEIDAHGADTSRSQSSLTEMKAPHTDLSPLGRIIDHKIREIGTHLHEEDVTVTHHVIMPSHIHFIIEVSKPLPMHHQPSGKEVRWTLSDIIKGFEKGCTSWYYRYLEGESIEDIFANPTKRRTSKEPPMVKAADGTMQSMPSIWYSQGFNDKILMTEERLTGWQTYLCNNPYYWRLQDVYPELFEHRLHLTIAGTDYSAYGCLFLLRKLDRVQVKCHRYKMDPTERYRLKDANGQWIPYETTADFQKQRAEILAKCEQENAIIVSPAISNGEKAIVYEALELGYPVINLVKDPIPEKGHANDKDRAYCARGQMLVLGPWEIKDTNNYASRFGDADSRYAKFHNLNDMAAELCKETLSMVIDRKTLEKCR